MLRERVRRVRESELQNNAQAATHQLKVNKENIHSYIQSFRSKLKKLSKKQRKRNRKAKLSSENYRIQALERKAREVGPAGHTVNLRV